MLKEVPCPICRRRTAFEGNPFRPFCSERCKLNDLGNWALERYRVAGAAGEGVSEEGEDATDEPRRDGD